MIYALRQPVLLLGLVAGFVAGAVLKAELQRGVVSGRPRRRLRQVGRSRARAPWSAALDPYGAVAVVISGAGWGALPSRGSTRSRGRAALLLAAAVIAHGVLAIAAVAAYRADAGDRLVLHLFPLTNLLHGSQPVTDPLQRFLLGFLAVNVACAVLALVPIPPLEAGVLVWMTPARNPTMRRIAYALLEEQWGVAVLLLLLLLPLAGERPPLLALVDAVAGPLLRLS